MRTAACTSRGCSVSITHLLPGDAKHGAQHAPVLGVAAQAAHCLALDLQPEGVRGEDWSYEDEDENKDESFGYLVLHRSRG